MKYLLDTHILFWAAINAEELGSAARYVLANEQATFVVSVISFWELAIKASTGKLDVDRGLLQATKQAGYEILPVQLDHVNMLRGLPLHHRDPFDRMLVAQAQSESMTLLTRDRQLQQYSVATMLV